MPFPQCNLFIDCENNQYDTEALLRLLVTIDPDGCPVLRVTDPGDAPEPVAKTPVSIASSGVTVIPIGASDVSIFNNGALAATTNGTTHPAGFERSFGFKNDIDTAITVTGGGNLMIIDYML